MPKVPQCPVDPESVATALKPGAIFRRDHQPAGLSIFDYIDSWLEKMLESRRKLTGVEAWTLYILRSEPTRLLAPNTFRAVWYNHIRREEDERYAGKDVLYLDKLNRDQLFAYQQELTETRTAGNLHTICASILLALLLESGLDQVSREEYRRTVWLQLRRQIFPLSALGNKPIDDHMLDAWMAIRAMELAAT